MTSNGNAERRPADPLAPADARPAGARERELGDFTTPRSVLGLATATILVGGAVALLALAPLDLIGLITHLAYTGTFSTSAGAGDQSD
ncbi:MAG: hypothetical protein WBV85_06560 [Solirubrobacteraceae bacterium]